MKASTLYLILFVFCASIVSRISTAQDYYIFSLKKDFPMSNDSSTPPSTDYYVTMGSKQGLKEGMILDVFRKVETFDYRENKIGPNINAKIAYLKVISADESFSITRLLKMLDKSKRPTLYVDAPTVGDLVDISLDEKPE